MKEEEHVVEELKPANEERSPNREQEQSPKAVLVDRDHFKKALDTIDIHYIDPNNA